MDELGVFLKNQMGKKLAFECNVSSNLDSEDADNLTQMCNQMVGRDTFTLTLASDEDIQQILSGLDESPLSFEGFSHAPCSCCTRVVLQLKTK